MKLTVGLAAALAGYAAAAQQAATVYQLSTQPSTSSKTTPSLSPSLARLVLLQRLSSLRNSPSSKDFPNGVGSDEVVSTLRQFGKTVTPLFGEESKQEPSQLVLMLEDMTPKQIKEMGKAMKIQPAYTIPTPPSASAHGDLVKFDFYNVGVTNEHQCTVDEVVNPLEEKCWSDKSTVAKYSVKKDPAVIKKVIDYLASLQKLSRSSEMETTILLLPETTEGSSTWSDKPQELRRRQFPEQVISPKGKTVLSAMQSSTPALDSFYVATGSIRSCYEDLDSCIAATNNCTSHGQCRDRYAPEEEDEENERRAADDDKEDKRVCFSCHCMATASEKTGTITHWGGIACAKKDISVEFWLFAGFTLGMVTVLYLAIGMLFSVGEEKLPGVIGAGVSRSKQ